MSGDGRLGKLRGGAGMGRAQGLLPTTEDDWLSHEDALTMLVRDLAVQLEDMAGQLDEHVRLQSSRMQELAAQVSGIQRHRGDVADSVARLAARCDGAAARVCDLDQRWAAAGFEARLEAAMAEVERLEGSVRCGAEWQQQVASDSQANFVQLAQRLEHVERSVQEWAEVQDQQGQLLDAQRATHDGLVLQTQSGTMHHALITERLNVIEKNLGDWNHRHDKQLQVIETQQAHQDRLEARDSSLNSRVQALEHSLGGWEQRHEQHKQIVEAFKSAHSSAHDLLATKLKSHQESHGSVVERLRALEDVVGSHRAQELDRVGRDSSSHQVAHEQLAREFKAHQGSVVERLQGLQDLLGSVGAQDVDRVARDLSNHKVFHDCLARELRHALGAQEERQAAAVQRLQDLEQGFEDRRGQQDLVAQTASHSRLASELRSQMDMHQDLTRQQVDHAVRAVADRHESESAMHRATMGQQIDDAVRSMLGRREGELKAHVDNAIQEVLARHDKQTRSLELWSQSHERLTSLLETCQEHCSSIVDRVNSLQRKIDDHDGSIENVNVAHGELARTLSGVNDQWDQSASLATRLDRLQRRVDEQNAAIEVCTATQRELKLTRSRLESGATRAEAQQDDQQASELQRLSADAHATRSELARLERRLAEAERQLGDATQRHRGELAAAHTRLATLVEQLSEERSVREVQATSIGSLVSSHAQWSGEKASMADGQARAAQRLVDLERAQRLQADRQTRELEDVGSTLASQTREIERLREDVAPRRLGDLGRSPGQLGREQPNDLQELRTALAGQALELSRMREDRERHVRELEDAFGTAAAGAAAAAARDSAVVRQQVVEEFRRPLLQRFELLESGLRDCRQALREASDEQAVQIRAGLEAGAAAQQAARRKEYETMARSLHHEGAAREAECKTLRQLLEGLDRKLSKVFRAEARPAEPVTLEGPPLPPTFTVPPAAQVRSLSAALAPRVVTPTAQVSGASSATPPVPSGSGGSLRAPTSLMLGSATSFSLSGVTSGVASWAPPPLHNAGTDAFQFAQAFRPA